MKQEEKMAQKRRERAEKIENSNKKKKIGKIIIWVTGIVLVLALAAGIFLYMEFDKVYKTCYVEAGVTVKCEDFFKEEMGDISFASDSDIVDSRQPGEYHIVLKGKFFTYQSTLIVQDTIAPAADGKEVRLEMGKECDADEFVDNIEDATQVLVSFVEKPDFNKPGKQDVTVKLTDAGQNETEVSAALFISSVVTELSVEAGSEPPALSDFVIEGEESSFITDITTIDYLVPEDKTVKLLVDGITYEVTMHIVDTIPPELKVINQQSFLNVALEPEDFVSSVNDVTEVSLKFVTEPDYQLEGTQRVEVCATDLGGNETVATADLTLSVDTEAPVISGVTDLYIIIGNTISYKKNVKVTDNCMRGLSFTVNNQAVNLSVEGTYPIEYVARDAAGNETRQTANVIVKPRVYTEEEIYGLADGILARIITPEMDQLTKATTIFNYIRSHISYISHSEKGNWLRSAYEGMVDGKGDCYVYASTAKALLTRAGIVNMDIAKIPSKTSHFWNLVDVGGGWYHFDTTPRKDHPTIFMWSEAQMMEYSALHNNSHNYDHTLYPTVN